MLGEGPSPISRTLRQSPACLALDGTLGCLAESRNGEARSYRRLVVEQVVAGYVGSLPVGLLVVRGRDVAQPGSAPEWGSGGRGFKSRRPDW